MISLSNNITEIQLRYDNTCTTIGMNCTISFTIANTITDKVFIYYQLENFYQNHRRYVKSRNIDQLAGTIESASSLSTCDPIIYNRDIPATVSFGGYPLNPNEPANPCGLIARSVFNGSLFLYLGH